LEAVKQLKLDVGMLIAIGGAAVDRATRIRAGYLADVRVRLSTLGLAKNFLLCFCSQFFREYFYSTVRSPALSLNLQKTHDEALMPNELLASRNGV
jgi:hypothetical protein